MHTIVYEDKETAPVSCSLQRVSGGNVKMVFAGGANNLVKCVCSQKESVDTVVFYDLPPNNLVACEYYKTVVQTLAGLRGNVYVIPVLCTEYVVLRSLIARDDFRKSVYQKLYMLLVESFDWDEAVKFMSQTNMLNNGKPKSLEKVYKELLANVRYDCLHNKERFGKFYKGECFECGKFAARDEWNRCEFRLKGTAVEEIGARIYVRFPAYFSNAITDALAEKYKFPQQKVNLHEIVKKQINTYRAMCQIMHVAPVI